jgi:hypothetical protein
MPHRGRSSSALWAALETTEVRKSSVGASPRNLRLAADNAQYQLFLRNNRFENPTSPLLLKRTNSTSTTDSCYSDNTPRKVNLQRQLKKIKSPRSYSNLNKNVIISQKAFCFLTELPMPSIFFRVSL